MKCPVFQPSHCYYYLIITSSKVGEAMNTNEEFEKLINDYSKTIWGKAWEFCKNKSDTDDLYQQAVLKAFKSFHTFDGKYPAAWLKQIVKHAYYDSYNERIKKPGNFASLDISSTDNELNNNMSVAENAAFKHGSYGYSSSAEKNFFGKTYSPKVVGALQALPDGFMEVVVLYAEGFSGEEIAERLNISHGTVRSRIYRAKEKLRDALL